MGGSTRIPLLRRMLSERFGGKELCTGINPDEAVAQGAAIHAAVLTGADPVVLQDILMMDRIPLSIGLQDADGRFVRILPRHACLIRRYMSIFKLTLYLFSFVIRNTPIPAVHKMEFHTFADNQPAITVKVFEGENEMAVDNVYLGEFDFPIRDYKGKKKGERRMEVSFQLNSDGLLKVTADTLDVPPSPLLGPWAWGFIAAYFGALFACVVYYMFFYTGITQAPTDSDTYSKMWCTSTVFSYLPQCQDTVPLDYIHRPKMGTDEL